MKATIYLLLFGIFTGTTFAQKSPTDSLTKLLGQPMADTSRVLLLDQLGRSLMYSKPLEAMELAQEGLDLADKIDFPKGKTRILNRLGSILRITGNYPKALEMHLASLQIAENKHDLDGMAKTLNNMGILYLEQKDTNKANEYFRKAKAIAEKIHDQSLILISLINIGSNYAKLNQLDSALIYTEKALQMAHNQSSNNVNVLLMNLGNISFRMGNFPLSLQYYRQSLPYSQEIQDNRILSQTFLEMAQVFKDKNELDSCFYYAKKSFDVAQEAKNTQSVYESSKLLATLYDAKDQNQAYYYFKLAAAAKDIMFDQEKVKAVQNLGFNEQIRLREFRNNKKEFENKQKIGLLFGIIFVVLLLAAILHRNNQQKQRANALLQQQKDEIHHQRDKAEKALIELKNTQAQLIQNEKLASLGELTAGIAHEIQNPLNFVNNFSELSVELIEELKQEREVSSEKRDEDLINELLADLSQNQEKINFHGKRASSIVKGMLEHSRANKGERAKVDLNQLADEYLRLSYHGMRAKDKDGSTGRFNANYELIADNNLPLFDCVPQDIGRVLLNLINNAFYAVYQRSKTSLKNLSDSESYQPKVTIRTIAIPQRGGIEIRVEDNGIGISKENLEKIFLPFFTTKATGEGTGLGLSLSYDIVTQGYGGTLEVESTEGGGTTFIVRLPNS